VDERGDAAGIPLTAVLVLRNLARNLRRLGREEEEREDEREAGGGRKVAKFFGGVEGELWFVFAHNKSLVSLECPYLLCFFLRVDGLRMEY
jgi:chromatin structure-remodeling complex subunit RSC9